MAWASLSPSWRRAASPWLLNASAVTRSAVAKTIARLEQRLKVRLFNRTTRKQSLTDHGQSYYERCVRALAELEAAEECLESNRKAPAGKLRVTAPVLFGRHCVAPTLLALSERHRDLQLEVSFNDRVVDLVEEGFDLAVRVGPLPDSSNLVARRLGMQRMGICASPEYLARHGRPSNASELNGHLRIAYLSAGRAVPWRVFGDDGEVFVPQVKIRLGFDDLQAIADAAIAGAGLAWLPCWMMSPEVKAGRLDGGRERRSHARDRDSRGLAAHDAPTDESACSGGRAGERDSKTCWVSKLLRRCPMATGLLVRLDAQAGKEREVEQFLKSALPLVEEEIGTRSWFAVRFGKGEYGIFDTFLDDASLEEHLQGPVAMALQQSTDLFDSEPRVQKVEVLADKLPVNPDAARHQGPAAHIQGQGRS